jgi:phosphoribosylanthranilate isomerase
MNAAIKICGITSVTDARAAVECGAEYLGLIFVEQSARKVSQSLACEIAASVKGQAKLVGVFMNAPAQQIVSTFSLVGLDFAQYHGQESPAFVKSIGVPAIKVFELSDLFSWENVEHYLDCAQFFLLDRPKGLHCRDWLDSALATANAAPAHLPPYFFAGGLNPDNVGMVINRLKKPFYGIDVASGVETEPGIKDLKKLKRFCNIVQEEASKCGH